ncbi:hypothetical protein SAMN05518865_102382 [Duganella sp. CF458]|uniref:hypothetical protein n=1 Tax=Duganella sp. CF458 TaxID=1884368 RepID=UPI0008E16A04|nr:hypothetical protein [Duganella sp. CF458]SFF63998.1 hypothetical protein SAMN05518865_102382 [Duganella sp. CF458]
MANFTWTYLQILELGRAPLTILAAGIFATMLQIQVFQHRQPMKWLVVTNYAILAQFAVLLLAWLAIAVRSDRQYYYFIFNFFLLTWTSLPFFVLACLVPISRRR